MSADPMSSADASSLPLFDASGGFPSRGPSRPTLCPTMGKKRIAKVLCRAGADLFSEPRRDASLNDRHDIVEMVEAAGVEPVPATFMTGDGARLLTIGLDPPRNLLPSPPWSPP